MKVFLLIALFPLLAFGFDKKCTDRYGKPISSKPFKIRNNCDAFYQCSNGYLTTQSCAPGTVFNPALSVCDWPSNVPDCKLYTTVACENAKNGVAQCPTGSVILIKDAFYGRDDGTTCPSSNIKTTDCAAAGSAKTLRKACNQRNSCNLEPTNAVFGDPCVGTYKYIKMQYYCKQRNRPSRWNKEVICEHDSKTLQCPSGQVIWVKSGSYGRDDKKTCANGPIKTTSCAASGSLANIRSNCNGKNTCTVEASNSVFGDPCYGTFKYVEVLYLCHNPTGWKKATICENKKQTFTCPSGQVLRVGKAYYGRDDGTTCPSSSIKTTECAAAKSGSTIKSSCNGKSSCTVEASNSVFGDPCVGTYKYVEMYYICRNERRACVDKNGKPISSHPFEKPGDCDHFYQCSNGVLHTMPCAPGTAFNPSIGVCDWPYNVPGCS